MPSVTCRHGVRIREAWWECGDCVDENGYSSEDVRRLERDHERQKREYQSSRYQDYEKRREEEKPKELVLGILRGIGFGILFYFLVGFGGCVARVVVTNDWIKNDTPGAPLISYSREAVLAFVIVLAISIYTAIKDYRK